MITRMLSFLAFITSIKRRLPQAFLLCILIAKNADADHIPAHGFALDSGNWNSAAFRTPAHFFGDRTTFPPHQCHWQAWHPTPPLALTTPARMLVLRRALLPLHAGLSAMESNNSPIVLPRIQGIDPEFQAILPRLRIIFEREGIPSQLVWLAEVESRYNPRAVSCAGAAGLFQLMPATAKRFGLRTGTIDERIVPERNATAAARYLKFLHRQFGCWPLAMAAYNAGEGRVARLLQTHTAENFAQIAAFLPRETRNFVPKVMTVVALREDQMNNAPGSNWMP